VDEQTTTRPPRSPRRARPARPRPHGQPGRSHPARLVDDVTTEAVAPEIEQAIERMKRAIGEYVVTGISTTLQFGKWVMNHQAFVDGKFDTGFIPKYYSPDTTPLQELKPDEEAIAAVLATQIFGAEKTSNGLVANPIGQTQTSWYRQRKSLR